MAAPFAVSTPYPPPSLPRQALSPTPGPLVAQGYGVPPAPAERAPLRCRLGRHNWRALALSLPGAPAMRDVSFCLCCPAVRR